MPSKLKSEWKRIGRSGKTIDGRIIEPEWVIEAAENYDKDEQYTALMWPEHERWYNMGTIERLKYEKNNEGGVDLYAEINPNQYYLDANKAGQKLFTSMELRPNFRDLGIYYLTGCAATDNPASAATTEVRFSKSNDSGLLIAEYVEITNSTQTNEDQPPRWFTRLFSKLDKSDEGDMSKDDLNKIQASLTALTERFNAAFPAANHQDTTQQQSNQSAPESEQLSGLAEKLDAFSARLDALEGKKPAATETENTAASIKPEEFKALQDSLTKLTEEFKAALNEQPGTDAGDHVNDGEDLNAYV